MAALLNYAVYVSVIAIFVSGNGFGVHADGYDSGSKSNHKRKEMKGHLKSLYLKDLCGTSLNLTARGWGEMMLEYSSDGMYSANVDCSLTLEVGTGHGVVLKLLYLEVSGCGDSLEVYTANTSVVAGLCTVIDETYIINNDTGRIRFISDGSGNTGKFKILVTAFYPAVDGYCKEGYFQCENSRCIYSSVFCNKRDNCGDNSDEYKGCGFVLWILLTVLGVFFGCAVIGGIGIFFVVKHVSKHSSHKQRQVGPSPSKGSKLPPLRGQVPAVTDYNSFPLQSHPQNVQGVAMLLPSHPTKDELYRTNFEPADNREFGFWDLSQKTI